MSKKIIFLLLVLLCAHAAFAGLGLTLHSAIASKKRKHHNTKSPKLPRSDDKRINDVHDEVIKIKVVPSLQENVMDEEEEKRIIDKQKMFESGTQMALSLTSMLLSRVIFKLNFKNAKVVSLARAAFSLYIVGMQVLQWFLVRMIKIRDDVTELDMPAAANPMAALGPLAGMLGGGAGGGIAGLLGGMMGGKPAAADPDAVDTPKMTIKEYDLGEVKKLFSGLIFEILAGSYLHFVNKNGAPLLMIPVMGLINKLKAPIIQLHILRFKAVGDLKRPFKTGFEKMIANQMNNAETQENDENTLLDSSEEDGEGNAEVEEVSTTDEDVPVKHGSSIKHSKHASKNTKVNDKSSVTAKTVKTKDMTTSTTSSKPAVGSSNKKKTTTPTKTTTATHVAKHATVSKKPAVSTAKHSQSHQSATSKHKSEVIDEVKPSPGDTHRGGDNNSIESSKHTAVEIQPQHNTKTTIKTTEHKEIVEKVEDDVTGGAADDVTDNMTDDVALDNVSLEDFEAVIDGHFSAEDNNNSNDDIMTGDEYISEGEEESLISLGDNSGIDELDENMPMNTHEDNSATNTHTSITFLEEEGEEEDDLF